MKPLDISKNYSLKWEKNGTGEGIKFKFSETKGFFISGDLKYYLDKYILIFMDTGKGVWEKIYEGEKIEVILKFCDENYLKFLNNQY